jgi:hypothetical protein
MDGETPQSVTNRIDQLDRRLKEVEKQSRGWVAKIGRVGIIVGCIGGILGGTSTFLNLWKSVVTATPNLVLVPGDGLCVQWSSENQRLSLTWGLTVQNKGEAIGVVKAVRAHIKSKAWETGKQQRLGDIQVTEKRVDIPFPVSVKAADARDLEITMASDLTHEAKHEFFEEGLYSLTLEVDVPQAKSSEYCIYVGKSLLKDLREKGLGKLDAPDPRCISSINP